MTTDTVEYFGSELRALKNRLLAAENAARRLAGELEAVRAELDDTRDSLRRDITAVRRQAETGIHHHYH
jgi:hypothetical protein